MVHAERICVLGRLEWIVVTALFTVTCVGVTHLDYLHFFQAAADAANMVDFIKTVASGNGLVNHMISSNNEMWPLFGADAATYCHSDFVPRFPDASDLKWHAYFITFPLAALTFLPGANALVVSVTLVTLSHLGALWVSWFYLRRRHVPLLLTLAFVIAVFMFKPWSESIIGQIYFDRLFIISGMVLVFGVHSHLNGKAFSVYWLVAIAIVCALISERPATMVAGFLIVYPILRFGLNVRQSRDSLILMGAGFLCLIYVFCYVKFVQDSPYLVSWTDIPSMTASFRSAVTPGGALFPQTMKLFVVLAPMLILTIFDWRMFIIVVGAILPNLFVSVGGAEKYVFATHYHMPYLPFLLAAAAIGLSQLWALLCSRLQIGRVIKPVKRIGINCAVTVGVLLVAVYSAFINPHNLSRAFAFDGEVDGVLVRSVIPGLPNPGADGIAERGNFMRALVSEIPRGSTVSSPEWTMPALVERGGITIDYMPFGIGMAQYVILVYYPGKDNTYKLDLVSYQTPEVVDKIRPCIQERVDQKYKPIKSAEFGTVRYIVYALK